MNAVFNNGVTGIVTELDAIFQTSDFTTMETTAAAIETDLNLVKTTLTDFESKWITE